MNQLNKRVDALETRGGAADRPSSQTRLVEKDGRLWVITESVKPDGSIHRVSLPDIGRFSWPAEMTENVGKWPD